MILIDCFCVILILVCSLRAYHMWLTKNHMFIREIWGKFTSLISWNFEISKFQKRELGKFIQYFPLKHVITSISLTGLVQFVKNLSYILPPLASYSYFQQSISVKLIYQFLYLMNGYLVFRYLEKSLKKERNQNKKGNSQSVITT